MAEKDVVFSIRERKLKLSTAEDCNEILALLNAKDTFERIELNGNTIAGPAARALGEAIAKQSRLQAIDISDIFTGRSSEIAPSMNAFRDALVGISTLTSVNVSDNAFGPDGVRAYIDLVARNRAIRVLNTNNTGLSPEGGRLIANALSGRLVSEYNPKEEEIVTDSDPVQLESFIAGRSRLEDGGAVALSKVFQKMGTLKEIRMPQNGIKPKGMLQLAESLARNPFLQIIDFNDNNIGKGEAAAAIAKALSSLRHLRIVNLGDCMMTAKSVIPIIQALGDQTNLEELVLTFSEIDDSTCALLLETVVQNSPKLRLLDINGNFLKPKGIKELKATLKKLGKEDILGSLSDNDESGEETASEDESSPESTPSSTNTSPVKSPPSSVISTPVKSPAKSSDELSEDEVRDLTSAVKKLNI